jgi:hypothetical protein
MNNRTKILMAAVVTTLLTGVFLSNESLANDNGEDRAGGKGLQNVAYQGGQVIKFAEAKIFFEFNAKDLDLGIHMLFDAEPWEEVMVQGPDGLIFAVENAGNLNVIGSTQLFTESAEPPLDEENLEDSINAFLALFPEGRYRFRGTTVEGDTLRGRAELTHDLPAAPELIFPDPEAAMNVADPTNTIIEWRDASGPGDPVIVFYQVVVEFEDQTGRVFKFSVDVLADPEAETQSVTVPVEFFESLEGLQGQFKAEVVAIEEGGNATIWEEEFEVDFQ